MSGWCVYIKYRPDYTPFYIGKGKNSRPYVMSYRNSYFNNIVKKYGISNIITEVIEVESEKYAFALEKALIKNLRAIGFKLSNLTDGGEGTSGFKFSKGSLVKRSASLIGKNVGKPSANKGVKDCIPWNKGKKMSLTARENMKLSKLGKPRGFSGMKGKIPWNKGMRTSPRTLKQKPETEIKKNALKNKRKDRRHVLKQFLWLSIYLVKRKYRVTRFGTIVKGVGKRSQAV